MSHLSIRRHAVTLGIIAVGALVGIVVFLCAAYVVLTFVGHRSLTKEF
jgi:hypothetical protein